jgi:RNA polymerase sigma-70 factor, ECF subfamily
MSSCVIAVHSGTERSGNAGARGTIGGAPRNRTDGGRLGDRIKRSEAIPGVGTTAATLSSLVVTAPVEESTGEVPSSVRIAATPAGAQALVAESGHFVFRILRRAGLDDATAEDATQQVFLIAARKLGSIEHGKEKAFLYTTAMHVASQQKRRTFRRAEVSYEEDSPESRRVAAEEVPSLDDLLDQRRAREILDDILAAMPEKLRDVFVLSEIEDLSAPEVAACLDVPVGTVASRLLRAREVFDQTLVRVRARRAFRTGTP